MGQTEDIDFVIPWVDGNDPDWRKRKNQLPGNKSIDDSEIRYRDWGLLRYWFRGVEKFAPWVRYVWFICDQEPPEWLNKEHPKLKIVRHEDYLPEEYRPAFSSHPIELNIHRINGLSERFVYFNDDTYLVRHVEKSFFFQNGLPLDSAVLNPVPTDSLAKGVGGIFAIPLNNTEYINRDYSIRDCMKKRPLQWFNLKYGRGLIRNMICSVWPRFVGFDEPHLPQAYLKKSFEDAWIQYYDILDATSRHHFRDNGDVNQWLIREKQLAEGKFVVRKTLKNGLYYNIKDSIEEIRDAIQNPKAPMICLNDSFEIDEKSFEILKKEIIECFAAVLGEKSTYELQG